MPPVILQYGFSCIVFADGHFCNSVLSKGRKLCTANYVYGVEETVYGGNLDSEIAAKCHSQVKQASYDVKVQVSVFNFRSQELDSVCCLLVMLPLFKIIIV